jgi:protein-S-isoprenylcysteine O-methyltransferase Ste14
VPAGASGDNGHATRLPALGRRGEGWVAGQVLLIGAVFLAPVLGGSSAGGRAPVLAAGGALLALGLLLAAWAGVRLGPSLTPFPTPRTDQKVAIRGPYALVRHPMYGGGILIALGWSMIFTSVYGLVLTVALAVFLDLKARREEAWLRERLEGYDSYRKRTPRKLVPFLY